MPSRANDSATPPSGGRPRRPAASSPASRQAAADDSFETFEERFTARAIFERVLHGVAIVILLALIVHAVSALREKPTAYASGADVYPSLVEWTTTQSPAEAHVSLDSVPSPSLRDWIAALPGAGTKISWEGVSLRPSAVTVEPVVDPKRPTRIWIAAPDSSVVSVRDELGVLDSIVAGSGGGVLTIPNVNGAVQAVVNGNAASSIVRDSLTIKPVLLLATASWEGKFIMASLEEHGWKVDAHFSLSPKVGNVQQGVPSAPQIDTGRYAAVIVLDTAGQRYVGQIEQYVRRGGGFIAAGGAGSVRTFANILPGNMSSVTTEEFSFDLDSANPKRGFARAPIQQLKPGAVPIERIGDEVTVAAQRVGNGRVLQVAYTDTWRWRMGGVEEDPVNEYRHWWTTMVSSIAYAPRTPLPVPTSALEPTPMASLVSILGQPTSKNAPGYSLLNDPRLLPVLFGILMAVLLVEWASRRLRGQP